VRCAGPTLFVAEFALETAIAVLGLLGTYAIKGLTNAAVAGSLRVVLLAAGGIAFAGLVQRFHLGDEAARSKLADQGRDGRPGQAGEPGEVGLADAAALAESVDDETPVAIPEGSKTTRRDYPQLNRQSTLRIDFCQVFAQYPREIFVSSARSRTNQATLPHLVGERVRHFR